jgi:ribosomal-protein-alanine N-acetyltransferase
MNLNPFKKTGPARTEYAAAELPVPQAVDQALLPALLLVEQSAYSHPWTQNNFADAMVSGYHLPVWLMQQGVWCYLVAMRGADEVHLLNFTVAPAQQRRGLARHMMQYLLDWSRSQGVHAIWLEVRVSNRRAIDIYQACGFVHDGVRPGYYPAHNGIREDAVVMSLSW